MGIVNLTPDSFSGDGINPDGQQGVTNAIHHAERQWQAGADILDIGAESSRPGSGEVSAKEEWQRLKPILEVVCRWQVAISVDTYKAETMARALDYGCDIINDINGFRGENALQTLSRYRAGGVVMHMQGHPATMQQAPEYVEVVSEVSEFLQTQCARAESLGISRERLAIDPGFGFGKTLEHNRALFQALPLLAKLGFPLLVGVSRKSMIGAISGRALADRTVPSVMAGILALHRGAHIIRVHDVAETQAGIKVWQALGNFD